jgi:CRP/FNR family transcriptional regulator
VNDFCQGCVVRNRAICAGLSGDELNALNRMGRRRQLQPGERLFGEGDEAVLVANVISGLFKLSAGTAEGGEQILGLAFPSDFVGQPFASDQSFDVEALTEAQVCVFPQADFKRFAGEHPNLEHRLLERTMSELDRARRWMVLLGRMTAEQRVASFILEMHERSRSAGQRHPGEEWMLPLSRQQIADLLGLTIETVSRQINAFRRRGWIELSGPRRVRVLAQEELRLAAGLAS